MKHLSNLKSVSVQCFYTVLQMTGRAFNGDTYISVVSLVVCNDSWKSSIIVVCYHTKSKCSLKLQGKIFLHEKYVFTDGFGMWWCPTDIVSFMHICCHQLLISSWLYTYWMFIIRTYSSLRPLLSQVLFD